MVEPAFAQPLQRAKSLNRVARTVDPELQRAAQAIAGHIGRPGKAWTYHPLKANPSTTAEVNVTAVDGSNALLVDNGAIWVGATRAAAISWPATTTTAPPTRLHTTVPAEAQSQIDADYGAAGFEAPRIVGAQAWLEAIRALDEAHATLAAAARLAPGALVLVDGAVRGLPRHAQPMADRVAEAAAKRGLDLVAVAKRSGIDDGGPEAAPLVPRLQREGPPGCWAVEVTSGTFVARLHARAGHAFRVDASSRAAVARLLPLSRDAAYCGYPYPLAVAHNRVALTGTAVADLKAGLEGAVRALGGAAASALLSDFHDVLDRNVPG